VDWGLYFEYWHLDADRGPGLVDLPAEPFRAPAGRGSVPVGASHLSVYDDRRRGGGPGRAPEDSSDVAVGPDGKRGDTDRAGCLGRSPRVGDSLPLVRIGVRPGVRRAGVFGADSHAGRARGHA